MISVQWIECIVIIHRTEREVKLLILLPHRSSKCKLLLIAEWRNIRCILLNCTEILQEVRIGRIVFWDRLCAINLNVTSIHVCSGLVAEWAHTAARIILGKLCLTSGQMDTTVFDSWWNFLFPEFTAEHANSPADILYIMHNNQRGNF